MLVVPAATVITDLPDADWLTQTATKTGIPRRALAAYAGASLLMNTERPTCQLSWNTLAGIGFVESEHGSINASRLDTSGRATPAIIGIALDGNSVAAIADTDAGRLDGDSRWDRAVGPMQLLPSSWERFASDGNGDGQRDPQQIDDATLAAARYLCHDGRDLRESSAWIAAVASYNRGVEYNNKVVAAANHYAATAR